MTTKKPRGPDPTKIHRARALGLAWIILPSAVVAGAIIALMRWPAPASVRVDAIANRVTLHGRGNDSQVLLAGTTVRSLVLRGFNEVHLPVASLSIANPEKFDLEHNTYPASAWTTLAHEQEFVLRPAGRETAGTTIRTEGQADSGLALDRVFSGPAEVTVESPERNLMGIDMRGEKPRGTVQLPLEFTIAVRKYYKELQP